MFQSSQHRSATRPSTVVLMLVTSFVYGDDPIVPPQGVQDVLSFQQDGQIQFHKSNVEATAAWTQGKEMPFEAVDQVQSDVRFSAPKNTRRSLPDAGTKTFQPREDAPAVKGPGAICPPAGRLAIVADGNSPDPDDIGATAVIFGLLKVSGTSDRLVHLSHSCDLKPTTRIPAADELRRQKVLDQICRDGVAQFGPFRNLAAWFNCRTQQQAAVDDLCDAINKASESVPLWIIEAGEPDVIGYALEAADASKRGYVHVVSHHPANDNTGDFFSWQQILDFGVNEHQIGDQNVGLKTAISPWRWAREHPDSTMQWIWQQLAYAEQDGVVKFQTGKFDCSDAGMVYWWITGADQGGDKHATPAEMAELLQQSAALPVNGENSVVARNPNGYRSIFRTEGAFICIAQGKVLRVLRAIPSPWVRYVPKEKPIDRKHGGGTAAMFAIGRRAVVRLSTQGIVNVRKPHVDSPL